MNLLELKSENQIKLFNYDKYFLNLVHLYNNKKLPNKIIFSGKKGIGKATFAYHLINYIFSTNEDFNYDIEKFQINLNNKSYNLLLNQSHPNFHLIDLLEDKKNIEISQIREVYKFVNKSSFNNREKIVLINNAEKLNLNSSNALLKIVEEPNDKVFFIIIYDSSKKILDTLRSRCLKFNFHQSYDQCIDTANKIIKGNIFDSISENLVNYYNSAGDLINLLKISDSLKIDISKINLKDFLITLIDKKYYLKNQYVKNYIFSYIDFYFLNLINFSNQKKKVSFFYENFAKKVYYLKKFNLDEESFFIELKTKVLNE